MTVWVVGDEDGALAHLLGRHVEADVRSGVPDGSGPDVVVVYGVPCPESVFQPAVASAVILVEPGIEEKDRVTRLLAAHERPRLEIVEHVAAGIRAERTWALVLALVFGVTASSAALRQTPVAASDLVTGPAPGGSWLELPPRGSLYGRRLGFVGYGPVAWRMSQWAAEVGMRVAYWLQPGDRAAEVESEGAALLSGAQPATFDRVLEESDVLVVDVDYADDSIRLIDAPELALMRRDALLVHTSHGRVIDEGALIQALRAGHLGGVALDRFNYEPLPADSPLRDLEQVILTPGIAQPATDETLAVTALQVADAIALSEPGVLRRKVRYIRRRPVRR